MKLKRCGLSSVLENEEMEVQPQEVTTMLSRESSVTIDSGLGGTSLSDDKKLSQESILMFENSDIEDQLIESHFNRLGSICSADMFNKPTK